MLGALERLQAKLAQREEWTHSETVGNLRETLQSPLFSHILTLQHSIKQLRNQVRGGPQEATGSSDNQGPHERTLAEITLVPQVGQNPQKSESSPGSGNTQCHLFQTAQI